MAKASVDVFINGSLANKSLRDLKLSASQLRNELARLEPTTAEFAQKSKKLQQVTSEIDKLNARLKPTKGLFSSISKELKAFGAVAIAAFGFEFITSQISNLISKNAKLSDSLADIRKTTGMSASEVKRFNEQLSLIDTRTSTQELRELAAALGQLGIEKDSLLGAVAAFDKLFVALGDEFGNIQDMTKTLGGLRNSIKDLKSNDVGVDFLKLGNAINELSAAGQATAPIVSDFANRIGGVASPMGLTAGQILGLSATMEELGITAERGGTATVKMLQKMTTDTKSFANLANVPLKEFTEMVNTDLYGAFLKVIEGASKSKASTTMLGTILQDLELSGGSASEVFMKLGTSTQMLKEKVDLATDSLKNQDSILNEFNTKNDTLAAKLERISKGVLAAFSNSKVSGWIENVVDLLDDWVKIDLAKKLEQERLAMEEEQVSLLVLEQRLYDVNLDQKERVKLINELKEKYPGYLKEVNADTVNNRDLSASLEKVNQSLLKKIVIQKQAEQIAKLMQPINEFEGYAAERTISRDEKIAKSRKKLGLILKEGLTSEQQSAQLIEQLRNKQFTDNEELEIERKRLLASLDQDQFVIGNWAKRAQDLRNGDLKAALEQMKTYEADFQKAFGMQENVASGPKKASGETKEYKSLGDDKAASKKAKAEAKALKEAKKRNEKYLDEIRAIEDRAVDEYNASIVDKYDRERAQAATVADREVEEARRRISDRKLLSMVESEAMQKYKRKLEEIAADEKGYHAERQQELLQELSTELANEAALEVATAERRKAQATTAQEYNAAEADLFKGRMKQLTTEYAIRLEAAKDDVEQQKILHENFLRDKANLTNEYYADVKNQAENTYQAEVEAAVQAANDIANVFFMMLDAIANQQQADYNNSMNELKRVKNAELKHLKDSLDAKTITEEKYNSEKDRIEKEYALKQYQMEVALFEKRQQMARIEALIKGALLAMDLSIKFTPVIGIALAAITTGSQLALIDSQAPPEPPAFALGGATKAIPGIAQTGGSIADGGVVSKPYYALVGEKGAEYIVPNYLLSEPLVADSVRMIEAFRTGRKSSSKMAAFADGGSTVKMPPRLNTSSLDLAILTELQAIKMLLQNPREKALVLSYQTQAKFLDDALDARYPSGIPVTNNRVNPRIFGTS